VPAKHAEKLLRSMAGKERAANDPRDGVAIRFVFGKKCFHGWNFSAGFNNEPLSRRR
jgi:hypothetical protein